MDLRLFNGSDGKPFAATIAWLGDEEPTTFAVPERWLPGRIEQIAQPELEENNELVKTDRHASGAAVLAYRHRETGRVLYVARTDTPGFKTYRSDIAPIRRTLRN